MESNDRPRKMPEIRPRRKSLVGPSREAPSALAETDPRLYVAALAWEHDRTESAVCQVKFQSGA